MPFSCFIRCVRWFCSLWDMRKMSRFNERNQTRSVRYREYSLSASAIILEDRLRYLWLIEGKPGFSLKIKEKRNKDKVTLRKRISLLVFRFFYTNKGHPLLQNRNQTNRASQVFRFFFSWHTKKQLYFPANTTSTNNRSAGFPFGNVSASRT